MDKISRRGHESSLGGREEGELSRDLTDKCRSLKDDVLSRTQAAEGKANRGGVLKPGKGC